MRCRAARTIRDRLGRRGAFLLILGIGKTSWGLGFLVAPHPEPRGLALLTSLAPLHCWAWVWVAAGIATTGCAFLKVGRDALGFVTALVPPTVWATAYTVAVATGDYPRGGWVALWYLTSHVGVIMWAAAVPEHSVPPPPRRPQRGKAP
ncbi:hypothetical protein H3146_07220 [Streptomyces sp. OF3]|uniref:Uncharacterized protein n=1 Tax=Streptomyces alkaliterrae TaxID=2213162 RepID=A0A7W3WJ56_9ACTN|nr:hypothetical protein [Streptomyces alkaliterrae]MBB1253160.1 hypothetical protein [Streptomyces alkaliterrae]